MRVLIDPDDLSGCRSLSRDFLTRIIEQSKAANRQFNVAPSKKKFVAKKDKVLINITMRADRHLYCWIVSPDRAAFVLFPWTKAQAAKLWKAGDTIQYPNTFKNQVGVPPTNDASTSGTTKTIRLQDVIYPHAAKELFSCFASPRRLPDDLEAKWIRMHAFNEGGSGEHRSIEEKGVKSLLSEMRRVDGIEEHYAWLEAVD